MNILELLRSILQEDTLAMIEQLYGNLLLDDDINVTDDAQSLMVGVAALCSANYNHPFHRSSSIHSCRTVISSLR